MSGFPQGGGVSDTAYGPSWDGVTGIAPSKNAVYDEVVALMATSLPLTAVPWEVLVDPLMGEVSHTNFGTVTANSNYIGYGIRGNNGSQNSEVVPARVLLAAGTWTFELLHSTNTDRGIYTVALDDGAGGAYTDIGTIDGYAASLNYNVLSSITGIVIATTIPRLLRLKMATKNASSSSYWAAIARMRFRRTA